MGELLVPSTTTFFFILPVASKPKAAESAALNWAVEAAFLPLPDDESVVLSKLKLPEVTARLRAPAEVSPPIPPLPPLSIKI